MNINYIKGDATQPIGDGHKAIVHICNDLGAWGSGFVLALSKQWPEPEIEYRAWHRNGNNGWGPFRLGRIQSVQVELDTKVINMIAQNGIGTKNGPPIRYKYLEECLERVADMCLTLGDDNIKYSVHMPRIGCGLAGGTWDMIEPIIQRILIKSGIPVTVYDLEQ